MNSATQSQTNCLPERAERVGTMSASVSFSVVRSVGRFGDVFFCVVDSDGWTVECYLESEGGENDAHIHASTGRRPKRSAVMSTSVASLFSR